MCHFVQFRGPFTVVGYVVMEEERCPKEGLHFFLGGGERHSIDGSLATVRELPHTMADFITKESHFGGSNERLLYLDHNAEFRAASDHPLKFVRSILVVIGKDKEVVEDDNTFVHSITFNTTIDNHFIHTSFFTKTVPTSSFPFSQPSTSHSMIQLNKKSKNTHPEQSQLPSTRTLYIVHHQTVPYLTIPVLGD